MRIQHNILAMNAYRNYNTNTSALAKNLEKLSSGYKINRAGDDAAGLAISEKMRAQITGLNAAQKNVKDGISLVKTAEGAMQEIQDMLNRMDYLATQSANGTYDDETDRAALQKEVNALREEINRIADSANFNGIQLLDGSLTSGVSTTRSGGEVDLSGNLLTNVVNELDVGTGMVLKQAAKTTQAGEFTVNFQNTALKDVQLGDTLTMTIQCGDTKKELTFRVVGDDADPADLGWDDDETEYRITKSDITGAKLGDAFVAAFSELEDQTIDGQEVTVSGSGNTVTITQTNEPEDGSQLMSNDLTVSIDYKGGKIEGTLSKKPVDVVSQQDAVNAKYQFKVGGVGFDGASIMAGETITIFGQDFEVTGSAIEDEAALQAFIDGKMSDVADALSTGEYDVTIEGNAAEGWTVTYEAKTAGAIGSGDAPDNAPSTEPDGTDLTFDVVTNNGGDGTVTGGAMTLNGLKEDGTVDTTSPLVTEGADEVKGVKADYQGLDKEVIKAFADEEGMASGDVKIVLNSDNKLELRIGDKVLGTSDEEINNSNTTFTFMTADGATIGTLGLTDSNGDALVATDFEDDGLTIDLGLTYTAIGEKENTGSRNVSTTMNKESSYAGTAQLASTQLKLDDSIIANGNVLTIGNKSYIFYVGSEGKEEWKKAGGGDTVNGAYVIDLTDYNEVNDEAIVTAGTRISQLEHDAFDIGFDNDSNSDYRYYLSIHEKANGQESGQDVYGTDVLGDKDKFAELFSVTKPTTTTNGKSLNLQIGDTSDNYNQMKVSIGDMHTDAMGTEGGMKISDISIATSEDAQEAVNVIRDAINYVSSVRGDLGAYQNRLEHTANNLSVMAENIQDAESTIRDTDIAEEMMSYTKNNILVQAAQAMLAQANAVPQGVLQLLG